MKRICGINLGLKMEQNSSFIVKDKIHVLLDELMSKRIFRSLSLFKSSVPVSSEIVINIESFMGCLYIKHADRAMPLL